MNGTEAEISHERRVALIDAMKTVFGRDARRVAHALKVLEFSEAILGTEPASRQVVVAAAILHDIGIQQAEARHGSSAGRYQEIEGPPIAREILYRLAFPATSVEHICRIIANHHSARDIDTPEFRVVWDADWLVNIPDEFPDADRPFLTRLIARVFKTPTGREMAERLFLVGA